MIKLKFSPVIILTGLLLSSITFYSCGTTEVAAPKAEETVKEAQKPVKKAPEDPPNVKFVKELRAFLDKGDTQGAINHFAKIPAKLKDDLELKGLLGALYYSDSQYDNAITTANEILAIDPQNFDALELISLCNRAKGDKAAYKAVSEKILSIDPYNASANIQKAEEYALNKKYKLARESYKKALKGDPDNKDAQFGYAQMSFYADDVKTAETVFQEMIDKDPENSAALAYMGKIAYDGENYLRAVKYVKEAIKYDPTNYDYWLDYGTYLRYQGKFDDAAKAWQKATELDPSYFLAYAYLAGNYDDLGKWDLALENYHKVIETNPKYYFAYESAAILEYRAKNYKEAINLFQKAYSYSPHYSYTLMIALCYYRLNDSINAKKVLAAQLKKLDANSTEYKLVRFYNDSYSKNAETNLIQSISKETNSNNRGKMLFYMGAYYDLNKADELANEYYAKVINMQAPMFFEYRIAEWGLQ